MNQTLKILTERGSCRAFRAKKVPASAVKLLIEAGIHAPTGGNIQPYSIIKIERRAAIKKLAALCGQKFLEKAPLHFIYCIDLHRQKRWAALENAPYSADRAFRPFWIAFQDTVICAQNMCVAADALGLGSVYIGPVFDRMAEFRRMCRLPKGVIPVVSLAVGYPAVKPPGRPKLPAWVVSHSETYRKISDRELLAAYAGKYGNRAEKLSPKALRTFERACRIAGGKAFAAKCVRAVERNDRFNAPQIIYGLHYKADEMLRTTPKQLKMLKAAGLGWPIARH